MVLSIVVQSRWPMCQLDVNNAFLEGHLDEDVYMRKPAGFVSSQYPHYVCKLCKTIYGLRQSSRAWHNTLKLCLLTIGFQKSESDGSLFMLNLDSFTLCSYLR